MVPAAHYTCGGVVTDLHGRSDVPGLYAVGETTYTGLHGANRLASNSLLECVVLGKTCAADILSRDTGEHPTLPAWDESKVENADEQVVISHNWDELRLLMWNYVGIVRTTKRLERALHRIKLLKSEIDDYYGASASRATCWSCATWSIAPSSSCARPSRAIRAAACTTAAISRRRCR